MPLSAVLFTVIALATGVSAVGVVATQNIVRAAVWLLFVLRFFRTNFAFVPLAPSIPRFQNGLLQALAVASQKRAVLLPTVPTTLEAGYENSNTDFWVGMFAPARTPMQR